jgi:hypothetical protein
VRIPARDVYENLEGVLALVAERCGLEQPLHRRSGGPPPRTGEKL